MAEQKEKYVNVDWEFFVVEYTDEELSDWLVEDIKRRYAEGDLDDDQLDAELDRAMDHDFVDEDFERYARTENNRQSD